MAVLRWLEIASCLTHNVGVVLSKGPLYTNAAYHSERGLKERQRSWANLYAWQLTRSGDAPLFRQIYAQLRAAILAQDLRPGTKLPSTRQLATQLSVSRSAVVSAYEQLLAEGYATGKIGSGSYVSSDLPEPVEGRRPKRSARRATAATPIAAPLAQNFVDVTVQSEERPFNLGRTLVDARTTALWRKSSARVFR